MVLMPASLSVIDEVIHLSVAESGLLSVFTCLFSVVSSVAVSMSLCPPVSLQTLLCKHP